MTLNKMYVNVFMAVRPRGNLIPVEALSNLFGKNIPKYSELTFLNKPNGDHHYLFCVDSSIKVPQICINYHYLYFLNQPQIYIDTYKYNNEHQIVVMYSNMYHSYYNLININNDKNKK